MNISKLKAIHVIIIGIVACIAVGVGVYFLMITNTKQDIEKLVTREKAAQAIVDTEASEKQGLEQARVDLAVAKAAYVKYEREKMPPITLEDRAFGMIALWKEQAETLGPLVKSFANHDKVAFLSDITIPAAPVNPNQIDPTIIKLPLGSFNVTGSFHDICEHVRRWNKFNRLVQIDGLSLKGYSPHMSASYSLTVYLMPRGAQGPSIPMAGGGGGGGGGMMGGGMMGGMMGMPGMPGMPGGAR